MEDTLFVRNTGSVTLTAPDSRLTVRVRNAVSAANLYAPIYNIHCILQKVRDRVTVTD